MNPPSDRPTVPPDCTLHATPCPGGCEIEDADGPDTRAPYPGVPEAWIAPTDPTTEAERVDALGLGGETSSEGPST